MLVLGLEGTAHTISAGIVDEERILSNVSSTYVSTNGGIHPREAAVHHSDKVVDVLSGALKNAGLSMKDIDLVAFSRGPGLGPCLRVVGTAARSLSLKFGKDIIGVNHPLGHVEIGRKLGKMRDPIVLYVSGGNTQVLAHTSGKYRVMGETMDIGLGNMLDKFARDIGIGFPGGPRIEKFATNGEKLLDLPYSVKGMDTSFSGIYTAAKAHKIKGEEIEDISYSIQETAFSMLIEVLERSLYYFDKNEILLAGGVAANSRLREMVATMAEDAGIELYLTDRNYCMDNGAMIAQAGMLMHQHGESHSVKDSTVDQRFRIDSVRTPWIPDSGFSKDRLRGAESIIQRNELFGRKVVTKTRLGKKYRVDTVDDKLRRERTRNEAAVLMRLMEIDVPVPLLYDVNSKEYALIEQDLGGCTLRSHLKQGGNSAGIVGDLAGIVAKMHSEGISHGDLTTNNIIVSSGVFLIDPSLGSLSAEDEDLATDLFLLLESFKSNHSDMAGLGKLFLQEYRKNFARSSQVVKLLHEIQGRRRYV